MGNIIILRGQEKSGKTTITRQVFLRLAEKVDDGCKLKVWYGHEKDAYEYKDVASLLSSNDKVWIKESDFNAILIIDGKKIGIVSEGDKAMAVEPIIQRLVNQSLDLLICCARSINRQGSVYRMIITEFVTRYPVLREFWTTKIDGNFLSADEALTTEIVEYVLQVLKDDENTK